MAKTARKHAGRKTRARKTKARKTGARTSTTRRKTTARRTSQRRAPARKSTRKWSGRVTETSDAMTLDEGVFKKSDPKAIARSVKRSAERSHRRKSAPFRSAMSMLTFYVNRGGKNLSARRKSVLMQAKDELRALYHKQ
jgi:hypothetical protein